MDPIGEVLYVSDTTSRRVYRVRNLGQPKDPSRNLEVVAGTGEQCLPFDQSHCGEGRKATEAALNNPRGRTSQNFLCQPSRLTCKDLLFSLVGQCFSGETSSQTLASYSRFSLPWPLFAFGVTRRVLEPVPGSWMNRELIAGCYDLLYLAQGNHGSVL